MKTTSPEPTQRLNVDLPKSQYFALKSYALHNDISVSQLVRDSLQDIVDYDMWFKARVQTAVNDPRPAMEPAAWDKIRAAKLAQRSSLKATA
jgi:hypothetical protein